MQRHWNPHSLPRIWNISAILEKSLALSQKVKHRASIWANNSSPRLYIYICYVHIYVLCTHYVHIYAHIYVMDWIVINSLPPQAQSDQPEGQGCLLLAYRRGGRFIGFSRLGYSCSGPLGQGRSPWLKVQGLQPGPRGWSCCPWWWGLTPVHMDGGATTLWAQRAERI